MNHERVLGIDYGSVRIGIAISDPLGMTAQPKPFIAHSESACSEILKLVREFDVKTIIVGKPKHTKGHETQKSEEVEAFANQLRLLTECPIVYRDERFSTQAASKLMHLQGINSKKQRKLIDSESAAFVLQGYLDQR